MRVRHFKLPFWPGERNLWTTKKNNMGPPNTLKRGVMAVMALAVFLPAASASVVGTLDIGSGGGISVSLNFIRFLTDPSANPAGPPWNGEVASPTSLTFAGCPSGVLGSPGCLSTAEAIEINSNANLTAAEVLPANNFMIFAANASIDYTLTQVLNGSTNSNCAGLANFQSCSVFVGSPVVLTLVSGNTTATLSLAGIVTDGVGPTSSWSGSFSVTFPNTTPGQLQLELCPTGSCTLADFTRNTVVSTSQSGTFSSTSQHIQTAVPEPYSMLLIGGGLVGLASLRRRKRRNVAP